MQRHTVDGGGPSEAARRQPGSAPAHGPELAQRVLLHWRVRCLVRLAPLRATSGADALALCAGLLWTLDHRAQAPGLALAARRWAEAAAGVPDSARALECLDEVVVEIAEVAFPGFPPQALRRVLDLVKDVAAAVPARRAARPAVDSTTGLPDRRSLERDLDALVAAAVVGGGPDLAVAVVEPEFGAKGSLHRGRGPAGGAGPGITALVEALRNGLGRAVPGGRLYHLGVRRLAVLVPRGNTAAIGEVMLWASCGDAPPFVWGASSLRAAGARAVAQPDALLVLAEADLHLRHRDLVRARAALARQHRQRRLVGSVAGALVLLMGVALGLVGSGPSGRPGLSALHAPPTTITVPNIPSTPAPAPSAQPSLPASVTASNVPPPSPSPAPQVHLVEAVNPEPSGASATGPSAAPPPGKAGISSPAPPSPPAHPSPPHPTPPHPPPSSSPPGQSPGHVAHVVGAVVGIVSGLGKSLGV